MSYLIKEEIAENKRKRSYSFNRDILPFPAHKEEKASPPSPEKSFNNTAKLFIVKETTEQERFIKLMSEYKKAECTVIYNFYTGGSPYKSGMMDVIYSGMANMAFAAA